MTQLIIYPQENGSITVLYPTGELPIEEVCRKDVPTGVPYKLIDSSDLPEQYNEFFNAWEADFTNPDGTGIGADAWFAEQSAKEQA
jgi:hypothetical protein